MTQSRGNWMEEKERESSAAVHGSHTHTHAAITPTLHHIMHVWL